jgi:hypothetical protein
MDVNDPVKCPDCGVWWRGYTHRCDNGGGVTATVTTGGGGPWVLTGSLSNPVQPDNYNVTMMYHPEDGTIKIAPIEGADPLLIEEGVITVYTNPNVYRK